MRFVEFGRRIAHPLIGEGAQQPDSFWAKVIAERVLDTT